MSTTYELQEKLKQLEREIQELLEEQNRYLRILNKRRQEELSKENSIEEELASTPTYLSQFVRKRIVALSKEDNLTKEQLEKRIEEAINYICSRR
jgi:cell division GTPase FtsZ